MVARSRFVSSPFIIAFLALLVARMLLLGRGAGEIWDESRYFFTVHGISALLHGNANAFVHDIVDGTLGRPGAALIWAPSVLLQLAVEQWRGISIQDPQSLLIPQLENLFILMSTSALLYSAARRFLNLSSDLSALLMLLHGSLISSNLYLRHLLSYDAALSLFLGTILLIDADDSADLKRRMAIAIGGSTVVFLIYPGYFFAVPILMIFASMKNPFTRGFAASIFGTLIFGAVLSVIDGAGALFGANYAGALRHLSRTIGIGSFSEGCSFPIRYLIDVEGVSGGVVLAAAGLLLLLIASTIRSGKKASRFDLLFLCTIAVMLCYCLQAQFLHKMVWYGRLIHFFIPILVLGAGRAIQLIEAPKRLVVGVLCLLSLLSISRHWQQLLEAHYPRDVLYSLGLTQQVVNISARYSCGECFHSAPQWRYANADIKDDASYHPELIFYNFCSELKRAPTLRCDVLPNFPGTVKKLEFKHYLGLPAYLYENSTPDDRAALSASPPIFALFMRSAVQ